MRVLSGIMTACAFFLLTVPMAAAQDDAPSTESLEKEIAARYRSFEGDPDTQTWEKWRDYFLNSPNIANMHGDRMEIGWEAYREGSAEYYQRPVEQRAGIRFEDLKILVIDDRTAWVMGTFVNIVGDREIRPRFYDMLVRTDDGWRVFWSYVAPPE